MYRIDGVQPMPSRRRCEPRGRFVERTQIEAAEEGSQRHELGLASSRIGLAKSSGSSNREPMLACRVGLGVEEGEQRRPRGWSGTAA